jgi:hypothetical protein
MSRRQEVEAPDEVEARDEDEPRVIDEDVEDFFEDDEKPTDRRRDPLRTA